MNIFKTPGRILYRLTLMKLKTRQGISRLQGDSNLTARALGNALDAVLKNSASAEEEAWIYRIESLRNQLNSSSTEVRYVDYGAGSPDLILTTQDMYRGRTIITTVGEVARRTSVSRQWAFLLFRLLRELKPLVCLELGTSLGISTLYQAAALELNSQGRIVTLEGAESVASIATENFERLVPGRVTVKVGRFQDLLGEVLSAYSRVNFAFIDGHHDEHATQAYFQQILPSVSENAVLLFDDISWSEGMARAWNTIASHACVKVSVNLGKMGLCVIESSPAKKRAFTVALE